VLVADRHGHRVGHGSVEHPGDSAQSIPSDDTQQLAVEQLAHRVAEDVWRVFAGDGDGEARGIHPQQHAVVLDGARRPDRLANAVDQALALAIAQPPAVGHDLPDHPVLAR
jgi:hypothetical protein